MHVHFIGVAGTLMGSVAGLLRRAGHRVTGSDIRFYEPMGGALTRFGVECFTGYRAEHLDEHPDLVVIGNVCRADNPEARRAIDEGFAYTHVAGAIQRFVLGGTRPLVVTGTHGKTTTTALAAYLLDRAGRQPGFLIGGIAKNFDTSFRRAPRRLEIGLSSSDTNDVRELNDVAQPASARTSEANVRSPFVIEGDEYDTAFFEKTPKFIHYSCDIAIITSIEHDHIDIYPTFADYRAAFLGFVNKLPESGLIVAHAGDPEVVKLCSREAPCKVAWYGLESEASAALPTWIASPGRVTSAGTQFDLYAGGVFAGRWLTPLFGLHNVKNTLAAIVACAEGYQVKLVELARELPGFQGVKRRQELAATERGIAIYDDFAHHPSAVRETLNGLRARHPQCRLVAIFEPRSATACRKLHQELYPGAFSAADVVLLSPLGRSEIPVSEQLDRASIVTKLTQQGKTAKALGSVDEIVQEVAAQTAPGDVIALLSNGDFGNLRERLVRELGNHE